MRLFLNNQITSDIIPCRRPLAWPARAEQQVLPPRGADGEPGGAENQADEPLPRGLRRLVRLRPLV